MHAENTSRRTSINKDFFLLAWYLQFDINYRRYSLHWSTKWRNMNVISACAPSPVIDASSVIAFIRLQYMRCLIPILLYGRRATDQKKATMHRLHRANVTWGIFSGALGVGSTASSLSLIFHSNNHHHLCVVGYFLCKKNLF